MIIDTFYKYSWKIKIFYECTCDDTDYIINALMDINCPSKYIKEAIDNLDSCNLNIGLTYSNLNLRSSVIVISKTSSFAQLINTVSHEYYHLICHISKTLKELDEEDFATLNGNLNMQSYKILEKINKKSRFQK